MKRTRTCDFLGIQYPILQGGMLWLAGAELAAVVSNAGGLGVISPYAGMERWGYGLRDLKEELRRVEGLTAKPFGVNIPLDLDQSGLLIDVLLQRGVEIVITAAGSPALYTELLKQTGVTVFHVISSVKKCKFAESCGVDAVISEGVEAAAHNGFEELPLFSLIPQVVDALSIPVIAAEGSRMEGELWQPWPWGLKGCTWGRGSLPSMRTQPIQTTSVLFSRQKTRARLSPVES